MPQFIVNSPDGQKYRVNAPDGATEADAIAYVQKQQGATAPAAATAAAQAAPEWNPTDDMNFGERALAGFGKSFVDTYRGVKQLGAEAGNAVGLVSDQTVAGLRAESDNLAGTDAALNSTAGGVLGQIAGTVAQTLAPAGALSKVSSAPRLAAAAKAFANPTTYRAAIASGALLGATRPVGERDSRTGNAVAGAALGAGGNLLANTIGRIAQPVASNLSPVAQGAVRTLEREGVPLDAAQRTASTGLQKVKQGLAGNPYTAGGQAAKIAKQETAYNRAVLRTIGAQADAATPDVLDASAKRIGGVFDRVAANNPIKVDNRLKVEVTNLVRRAEREGDPTQFAPLAKTIELLKDQSKTGTIDGRLYQNVKSSLDRVSMGADQTRGSWARELREVLDDALERSAKPGDFQALKGARVEYRRLLQITDAVDEGGKISPARLWQVVARKRNAAQAKRGRGDQELVNLARAGRHILTDKTPNSGTAERIAAQFAVPGAVAAAAGIATGDPTEALKYGGLAYAAPRAAQGLLNNPTLSRYLANGLQTQGPRNFLIGAQQNALLRRLPLAGAGIASNGREQK